MNCFKPLLMMAIATLSVACSPQSQNVVSGAADQASPPSSSIASATDDVKPIVISDTKAGDSAQFEKGDISMLRSSFEECVKASGGVVPDMQACIESEFEYQDSRLNRAYANLLKSSTESVRTELEFGQKKWLVERDAKCGWDANEEGQGQRLEANDCFLEMTSRRADELEATVGAL